MPLTLFPNLGAEEGPRWRAALERPAVAALATGLARICGGGTELLYLDEGAGALTDEGPVFPWLDFERGLLPWLSTEEAAHEADRRGLPFLGAPPAAVAGVHDKAFAVGAASEAGHVPAALAAATSVWSPAELTAPDALDRLAVVYRRWPAELGHRFVLKPRWGTSGRGRVSGGELDEGIARGLRGLAARGGAVFEPWLERTADFSVQLYVPEDGPLEVLGTTGQRLRQAGVYQGNEGVVDDEGRPWSGTEHDEPLVEAALAVAERARARGFFGPCGFDAFTFRDGSGVERLRPVVELNARFTGGTVLAGHLRRARAAGDVKAGGTFAYDATRDELQLGPR